MSAAEEIKGKCEENAVASLFSRIFIGIISGQIPKKIGLINGGKLRVIREESISSFSSAMPSPSSPARAALFKGAAEKNEKNPNAPLGALPGAIT